MSAKRKGLRNIPTAQKGGMRSRPRRPDDALNELAQLMRERDRLVNEQETCEERLKRINSRLKEIAAMERYLHRIVELRAPAQTSSPSSGRPRHVDQVTLHY